MSASCHTLIFCLLICPFAPKTILALGQQTIGQFCDSFTGTTINVTQLMGEWYEVGRLPAVNLSCVQTNLSNDAQQDTVHVNTSFFDASHKPMIKYDTTPHGTRSCQQTIRAIHSYVDIQMEPEQQTPLPLCSHGIRHR
ncbi:uncharacterized protein LOC115623506 isoform X2 [Scaptodrosophila lebanonensis]|uniref:Uncharacterized protein LOC115623506 isoform X2 n=1 Tax=Drosophila lebanonensis TaxID=7225 RepID=A0A6J2TA82_DROLE|nr:uncharacterized protein LOC115623506 isoform X2 [Scaptodrosophila lebanonensis]